MRFAVSSLKPEGKRNASRANRDEPDFVLVERAGHCSGPHVPLRLVRTGRGGREGSQRSQATRLADVARLPCCTSEEWTDFETAVFGR